MSSNNYGGPKLPSALLSQVNGGARSSRGGGGGARGGRGGGRNAPRTRKEERKVGRQQKKVQHTQPRSTFKSRPRQPVEAIADVASDDDDDDEEEEVDAYSKPVATTLTNGASKVQKSIIKAPSAKGATESQARFARESSPVRPPAVSKRIREKLDADDDEISALEKKLGIKSGKRGKAFDEDGLNDLLEGLDGDESSGLGGAKRKRNEDREWLESKRRRTAAQQEIDSGDDDSASEDVEGEDAGAASDTVGADGDDGFEGFESEEESLADDQRAPDVGNYSIQEKYKPVSSGLQQTNARENPYIAPQVGPSASGKYVPPSLRAAAGSDAELAQRLRRQTQGLLNRLSEANLLSILGDVEKLYRSNPRQYVTSTLIDLLIAIIRERTSLQDTFIILHAGFITGLYKLTGSDFGAQMIEEIVQQFDKAYDAQLEDAQAENGKEALNLMSLLAQLYNLQVIGSALIFDYLRTFLGSLSEAHTELLLRVIRSSGHQLRADDPSSLKDIAATLNTFRSRSTSVRTQFMIDSIDDLKNNKSKSSSGAASAMTSEHLVRMKKTLGTLNARAAGIKATEPLRIGLSDIRDTGKKGKWWLVGASWKGGAGEDAASSVNHPDTTTTSSVLTPTESSNEPDLLVLARRLRMNTSIRRAIFLCVMSASDYADAAHRLLKLSLTAAQRPEIPRVLIHCAAAERAYNPYYTLVAKAVLSSLGGASKRAQHELKVGLQRALWDRVPGLGLREVNGEGESDDDDDDDNNNGGEQGGKGLTGTVNLAKMFGALVALGVFEMDYALKNVEWTAYEGDSMAARTMVFLEVLLVTVLLKVRPSKRTPAADGGKGKSGAESLITVLGPAREFAPGLLRFLKNVVARSDLVASDKEARKVVEGCKEAKRLLTGRGGRMEIDEVVDWGDE